MIGSLNSGQEHEKAGEQMVGDKDTSEQLNFVTSPFDAIRHMDGEREFWRARELSKILGYNRWENFENVIAKAKIARLRVNQANQRI